MTINSTKHQSRSNSQGNMRKDHKMKTPQHHSHSHKRKHHHASSTTEPPSTPPPTNSDADTLIANSTPSKRVKLEASASPKNSYRPNLTAVESIYDTIVYVYIGSALSQDFGIHKGLLCKASSALGAALTSGISTEDIIIDQDPKRDALFLPNEDVSVFTRFNRWLYSSEVTLEEETIKDLTWADLISIYLFATKMKVTRLQNKCIDTTIAKLTTDNNVLPNAENMNRLWKQDTNAAPLRQLFLQLYARKGDLANMMAQPGNFHAGFMKGLVAELYTIKEGKGEREVRFWKKRKSYYVNDEENPLVVDE